MSRTRISTTVDAQRWAEARRLLKGPSSEVVDTALGALIEKLEGEREREALLALPYEEDPDLAWEAPSGPALPYNAEVPEEVLRLAERRRRARRSQ